MKNSRYIFKNGKKLRTGFTTGSCAAAASKAAVYMLFTGDILNKIEIDTPKGWKLHLDIFACNKKENSVVCSIIKDAGDDPDITDGIEICAAAKKIEEPIISIQGGVGVGVVTRKGMTVSVGQPAINPVPMKMIESEVKKVLPKGCGVEIQISVPKGEEIGKKTYNPKLGILGGISILGTSGIVEPMSEEAIKDTIAVELSCYKETKQEKVILVPGNYGEEFCKRYFSISEDKIIKISNFIGFALEKCAELRFKKVIVAGHIGKMIKPAAGIFNTHSRVCDTRMEILTAYLGMMGMKPEDLKTVMDAVTTEEILPFIEQKGFEEVYQILVEKCAERCSTYLFDAVEVGAIFFSMKKVLSISQKAQRILEEMANE